MSLNFTILVNYSSFGVAVAVAAFTQYNVTVKVPQLPRKPIGQLPQSRSRHSPKADRLFPPPNSAR
ncbi:hypothetical protein [[Phormidium] sp. ETS-05]|uniref:hypothetical protein n=1 Tax=[Phormidium] sp. ETS-05 TaxID=222819 RepID=UPI0018EF0C2E|nr:hypothetical protein [[Phormidium] sp. ETS-05]